MAESIKIELNEEEVLRQSDPEKINALVKLQFASHKLLSDHGEIIFGNGDPKKGLCFKVETQGTRLNWLIAILSVFGIAFIGTVLKYLVN